MKTIGITGGTGFVGQHLKALLLKNGYKVIIFTTGSTKKAEEFHVTYANWNPEKGTIDQEAMRQISAMVHLAGAGIADKRWTSARKKEIVDSRVKGTEFLVAQLKQYAVFCETFVCASATGFYGEDKGGQPFTEDAQPATDFLGETCRQWEEAAHKAEGSFKTAILRFGIVLGKESGAFAEFVKPMKFNIVPILGSGRQMVSWIEVNDLARLILFAIENKQFEGIYNAVTPGAVSHKAMMKTIALHKMSLAITVPVPAILLKLMLGEMSTEILKSCHVSAKKTLASGFTFYTPDLVNAVVEILSK